MLSFNQGSKFSSSYNSTMNEPRLSHQIFMKLLPDNFHTLSRKDLKRKISFQISKQTQVELVTIIKTKIENELLVRVEKLA